MASALLAAHRPRSRQKEEEMQRRFALALGLLAAAAGGALAESSWEIDPAHTAVQFSVRHMMISNVRGEFTTFSGTVRADEKDLTRSVIEATIDAASIDTRQAKRDEHLRSPDFLDVARFPKITFRSKRIEPAGSGRWKVRGDLTLHGVTREVVLDVEGPTPEVRDPGGKTRAGAHATTTLKRSDFGISWNKTLDSGGVVVGDDVAVTIDVEGVKQ
jgi:polyisoprenoid-binding protein YceI